MERQLGEKSYNPAKFEFLTIFSGQFNREYRNLFNRKLPGNILHSAYYTPLTIREMSLELGVSSVYMEDEVALLEKYKLLTALPGGKYQTNLVIFTADYAQEFYSKAKELCVRKIGEAIKDAKASLPEIRKIGFRGSSLDDNRLLWPFLWLIMRRGHSVFEDKLSEFTPDEIYSGATGINYGTDYDETEEYDCRAFAGYYGINDRYAAAFADFGVLPKSCQLNYNDSPVREALSGGNNEYPLFTKNELARVESLLNDVINKTAVLYDELNKIAVKLMKQHAPHSVDPIVDKVICKTLFFRTVGFIGKCAADSGALVVPVDEKPIAVYMYEINDSDQNNAAQYVQC